MRKYPKSGSIVVTQSPLIATIATSRMSYEEQANQVHAVIKDLETDEDVPSSRIRQGMQVHRNPQVRERPRCNLLTRSRYPGNGWFLPS